MTVAEYIQALQQLPQEADVAVEVDGEYGSTSGPTQPMVLHRLTNGDYAQCLAQYHACRHCARHLPLVQVVVL